jgi:hypothetical protein
MVVTCCGDPAEGDDGRFAEAPVVGVSCGFLGLCFNGLCFKGLCFEGLCFEGISCDEFCSAFFCVE